jgi:hypothetical protein
MHAKEAQHRFPPLGLVGILLAFAAAIALTPHTITMGLIRLRRMRKLAERFSCAQCGHPLSVLALADGKRLREAAVKQAVGARDLDSLEQAERIAAACSACKTLYEYDDDHRTYVPLSLTPPGTHT